MAIQCSTVNSLFQSYTSQFGVDIWDRYSQDSVWGKLTRVGKFPQGLGTTLNEITVERVLSGSLENDWADVAVSNGTSSNGCVPAPVDLSFGQTVRPWGLQTKAYQTPCICLDDLKHSYLIENQVSKTVDALTQLTKTVSDYRRRYNYMSMVGAIQSSYNTEYPAGNLNAVPVPTSPLGQDQLDELRVQILRDGGGRNALGKEDGQPVLGLICSPEQSRNLLRNNADLRQDNRFATPSELVAPLGVSRSYMGYYHMGDFEIPRFTYSGGVYTPIYPFVQVGTTQGYKWDLNPLYNTAPIEGAYIYHPDVYEEALQQVGPNIKGAAFNDFPHYYNGQFFWLNILSEAYNPLGKNGRWLSVFQSGARPINPTLGKFILLKRCVDDYLVSSCVYS